jgi:hypothetical protein
LHQCFESGWKAGRGINPRVKTLEIQALDASTQISAFAKLKLAICARLGRIGWNCECWKWI